MSPIAILSPVSVIPRRAASSFAVIPLSFNSSLTLILIRYLLQI
nr:MAG TPA: hypothetical protein [Caudoviricetes sp.]